ncbi:hypothetical protein U1Q18_010921 [Sarracenia purpurea var. burkii]
MATKLLLLVMLLGALACTSNARRLVLEKGAIDLENKFWHHFPRQGGGGIGGSRFGFGGGSGFHTGPGSVGSIGGDDGASGGLGARNGGGQGVGSEATTMPGSSTGSSDIGRKYDDHGTISGISGAGLP